MKKAGRKKRPAKKAVKKTILKTTEKPEKSAAAKKTPPRKVALKPIDLVARALGIRKQFLEMRGPYKAKISLDMLNALKKKKKGKYVVVSSITPTLLGEGKTVTAIGLSMALNRLNKKSVACLVQPSLAGVFGLKGPGTGCGLAQVFPKEDINLHFTGDSHAVEAAHDICASLIENSLFRGNPLDIDVDSLKWKRVADINDRSLRNVSVGMGSKYDGVPRKTGFDLTASSELMAILALSEDLKDMKERIARTIIGFTRKGRPVTCEDIKATGAVTALLRDAIKPNFVQTSENTPCFVHTGSSGAFGLGSSSVIADRIALALSDYVVTESGFGADIGGERFFDIKCRASGLSPDACVLVCSVKGLKIHSGDFTVQKTQQIPKELLRENVSAIERGLSNLEKQIENLRVFGVPVVLCINRFREDTEKEIQAISRRATDLGASAVSVSDVVLLGSEGGVELARTVMEACKSNNDFRFLYPTDMPLRDKIRRIARTIYGAKEVQFSDEANNKATMLKKLKLDGLPVCVAKTHLSLSGNPKRKGRPHGFKLPVEEVHVQNGAGYITAVCKDTNFIPGLPKTPRGLKIGLNEEGEIVGL